jgi:hypothetical protein
MHLYVCISNSRQWSYPAKEGMPCTDTDQPASRGASQHVQPTRGAGLTMTYSMHKLRIWMLCPPPQVHHLLSDSLCCLRVLRCQLHLRLWQELVFDYERPPVWLLFDVSCTSSCQVREGPPAPHTMLSKPIGPRHFNSCAAQTNSRAALALTMCPPTRRQSSYVISESSQMTVVPPDRANTTPVLLGLGCGIWCCQGGRGNVLPCTQQW